MKIKEKVLKELQKKYPNQDYSGINESNFHDGVNKAIDKTLAEVRKEVEDIELDFISMSRHLDAIKEVERLKRILIGFKNKIGGEDD